MRNISDKVLPLCFPFKLCQPNMLAAITISPNWQKIGNRICISITAKFSFLNLTTTTKIVKQEGLYRENVICIFIKLELSKKWISEKIKLAYIRILKLLKCADNSTDASELDNCTITLHSMSALYYSSVIATVNALV